jgi:hypothetical protein
VTLFQFLFCFRKGIVLNYGCSLYQLSSNAATGRNAVISYFHCTSINESRTGMMVNHVQDTVIQKGKKHLGTDIFDATLLQR